jgi:hypothetical protein
MWKYQIFGVRLNVKPDFPVPVVSRFFCTSIVIRPICPHNMFMPFSCGTIDSDYSIADLPEPDLKTTHFSA